MLQVWQTVLGDSALALDDNVFDHGAHSVLVVQVRNRLREIIGRDIQVALLFQYPTPAGLAAVLDRSDAAEPADVAETLDRASRRRAAAQGRRRAPSSLVP